MKKFSFIRSSKPLNPLYNTFNLIKQDTSYIIEQLSIAEDKSTLFYKNMEDKNKKKIEIIQDNFLIFSDLNLLLILKEEFELLKYEFKEEITKIDEIKEFEDFMKLEKMEVDDGFNINILLDDMFEEKEIKGLKTDGKKIEVVYEDESDFYELLVEDLKNSENIIAENKEKIEDIAENTNISTLKNFTKNLESTHSLYGNADNIKNLNPNSKYEEIKKSFQNLSINTKILSETPMMSYKQIEIEMDTSITEKSADLESLNKDLNYLESKLENLKIKEIKKETKKNEIRNETKIREFNLKTLENKSEVKKENFLGKDVKIFFDEVLNWDGNVTEEGKKFCFATFERILKNDPSSNSISNSNLINTDKNIISNSNLETKPIDTSNIININNNTIDTSNLETNTINKDLNTNIVNKDLNTNITNKDLNTNITTNKDTINTNSNNSIFNLNSNTLNSNSNNLNTNTLNTNSIFNINNSNLNTNIPNTNSIFNSNTSFSSLNLSVNNSGNNSGNNPTQNTATTNTNNNSNSLLSRMQNKKSDFLKRFL